MPAIVRQGKTGERTPSERIVMRAALASQIRKERQTSGPWFYFFSFAGYCVVVKAGRDRISVPAKGAPATKHNTHRVPRAVSMAESVDRPIRIVRGLFD